MADLFNEMLALLLDVMASPKAERRGVEVQGLYLKTYRDGISTRSQTLASHIRE